MTSPRPDLPTLAAELRLMACALVAELAQWLGLGPLAAWLKRRMRADLAQMERFATGIVVLAALQTLPAPPPELGPGGRRPLHAPPGFRSVAGDADSMRAMQRKLFPAERDLRRRMARFEAVIGDVARAALRLAKHIARIPPGMRLLAVAPPDVRVPARMAPFAVATDDSS